MKIIKNESYIKQILEKYDITSYFSNFTKIRPGIKVIVFPKNTFIYYEEAHRRYIYFLVSGQINIFANTSDGKTMLVRYCDEFVLIGDMELLGYSDPSNTIQTKSECICIGIDLDLVKSELMEDVTFLQFLCRNFAEKVNYLGMDKKSKHLNSAEQNIAEYMLVACGSSKFFNENLRRISDIFGISYRHLHRILNKFIVVGIIIRAEKGYEIVDLEALYKIANQQEI